MNKSCLNGYELAKYLLHAYGYVFYVTKSHPRLTCEMPFTPYPDGTTPVEQDFCYNYCSLLPMEDFKKLYNFFSNSCTNEFPYLIYCEKQNVIRYICGMLNETLNKKAKIDYEKSLPYNATSYASDKKKLKFWNRKSDISLKRNGLLGKQMITIRREQIVIYFLMFVYITLGPKNRFKFNEFLDSISSDTATLLTGTNSNIVDWLREFNNYGNLTDGVVLDANVIVEAIVNINT